MLNESYFESTDCEVRRAPILVLHLGSHRNKCVCLPTFAQHLLVVDGRRIPLPLLHLFRLDVHCLQAAPAMVTLRTSAHSVQPDVSLLSRSALRP